MPVERDAREKRSEIDGALFGIRPVVARSPGGVPLRVVLALVSLILSHAVAANDGPADESEPLPSFRLELEDQYGERLVFPPPVREECGGRGVTLLALADKKGADGNAHWARKLGERYRAHLEGRARPCLEILAVAHLEAVPSLLRGLVKGTIRRRSEREDAKVLPIGLDWKGKVAERIGLVGGVPNLALFAPDGRLALTVAGEADDAEVAGELFAALDALLRVSLRKTEHSAR